METPQTVVNRFIVETVQVHWAPGIVEGDANARVNLAARACALAQDPAPWKLDLAPFTTQALKTDIGSGCDASSCLNVFKIGCSIYVAETAAL